MYQLRTPGSADRFAESEGRVRSCRRRLWSSISSSRRTRQRRHYAMARSRLEAAQFAGDAARALVDNGERSVSVIRRHRRFDGW
jgi:hypothetical protein